MPAVLHAAKYTCGIRAGVETVELGLPRCVFLIGGMKCGSTSLFEALAQHSQVAPSRPKETNFLSMDPVWQKGPQWFARRFRVRPEHRIALEGSPSHSRVRLFPKAPVRMARLAGEPLAVMVLRDPIARMRSHMQHALAAPWGRPGPGIMGRLVASSDYAAQLAAYADAIGRHRMHVLTLDALRDDEQATFARLQTFLGLDPEPLHMPRSNPSDRRIWEIRPALRTAYRAGSHGRRRFLRFSAYHARRVPGLRMALFRTRDQLPLPDGWQDEARAQLAPSMQRLRSEWGIDVGRWGF